MSIGDDTISEKLLNGYGAIVSITDPLIAIHITDNASETQAT
jgi:hypothetical protein